MSVREDIDLVISNNPFKLGFANKILSITDDRWYIEDECPNCKGDCNRFSDSKICGTCHPQRVKQHCPDRASWACTECHGMGFLERDATIQEILDGKAVKR